MLPWLNLNAKPGMAHKVMLIFKKCGASRACLSWIFSLFWPLLAL